MSARERHGGWRRHASRALAVTVAVGIAAVASAQPAGSGSAGSATGSAGSAGSGIRGSGSAIIIPGPNGSAGSGGSAAGSAGSGVQGSGSATIIQIPTDSEAPEVTAAASPSAVKLGDRFTLFVTATYNVGVEVNLREPVELGGAFEVKKKLSSDTVRPDGRHVREWQIEVYAWELGDLQVPPVAVTFTVSGRAGQVQTNAVPIRVSGVLGDSDDPKLTRDVAPPIALHEHNWLWRLLHDPVKLGIIAGALIAAFLIQRRLRKRKRRVTRLVGTLAGSPLPRRRIDMTSERALERLLAIEQSGVLDRDDDRKAGYLDMTEVIRDYVGARFGIATQEATSSEILTALKPKTSDHDHNVVERLLERCDLVKYGGFRATRVDAYDVLESARSLVVSTTARPMPAESEAAA